MKTVLLVLLSSAATTWAQPPFLPRGFDPLPPAMWTAEKWSDWLQLIQDLVCMLNPRLCPEISTVEPVITTKEGFCGLEEGISPYFQSDPALSCDDLCDCLPYDQLILETAEEVCRCLAASEGLPYEVIKDVGLPIGCLYDASFGSVAYNDVDGRPRGCGGPSGSTADHHALCACPSSVVLGIPR